MLPIKNLIELVVKSLGRGLFVLKLTAIQARSQVPRPLSFAVPPTQPSHWPAWSHPAIKIVAMTANKSHAIATISPAKGHYPQLCGNAPAGRSFPSPEVTGPAAPAASPACAPGRRPPAVEEGL